MNTSKYEGNESGSLLIVQQAFKLIPEFDGTIQLLKKHLGAIERAVALVGRENENIFLNLIPLKLSPKLFDKFSRIPFTSVKQYVDYLRDTYDPPEDEYQLLTELGNSYQKQNESVEDFIDKLRCITEKLLRSIEIERGELDQYEVSRVETITIKIFKKGLLPQFWPHLGTESNLNDIVSKAKFWERQFANAKRLRGEETPLQQVNQSRKSTDINYVERETAKTATSKSLLPIINNEPVKCTLCGKYGHVIECCWRKESGGAPVGLVTCQYCKAVGHTAKRCPSVLALTRRVDLKIRKEPVKKVTQKSIPLPPNFCSDEINPESRKENVNKLIKESIPSIPKFCSERNDSKPCKENIAGKLMNESCPSTRKFRSKEKDSNVRKENVEKSEKNSLPSILTFCSDRKDPKIRKENAVEKLIKESFPLTPKFCPKEKDSKIHKENNIEKIVEESVSLTPEFYFRKTDSEPCSESIVGKNRNESIPPVLCSRDRELKIVGENIVEKFVEESISLTPEFCLNERDLLKGSISLTPEFCLKEKESDSRKSKSGSGNIRWDFIRESTVSMTPHPNSIGSMIDSERDTIVANPQSDEDGEGASSSNCCERLLKKISRAENGLKDDGEPSHKFPNPSYIGSFERIKRSKSEKIKKIFNLFRANQWENINTEELKQFNIQAMNQFYLFAEFFKTTDAANRRIPITDKALANPEKYLFFVVHWEKITKRKLLKIGLIRSSLLPYDAPPQVIPKKPHLQSKPNWRKVLDFRELKMNVLDFGIFDKIYPEDDYGLGEYWCELFAFTIITKSLLFLTNYPFSQSISNTIAIQILFLFLFLQIIGYLAMHVRLQKVNNIKDVRERGVRSRKSDIYNRRTLCALNILGRQCLHIRCDKSVQVKTKSILRDNDVSAKVKLIRVTFDFKEYCGLNQKQCTDIFYRLIFWNAKRCNILHNKIAEKSVVDNGKTVRSFTADGIRLALNILTIKMVCGQILLKTENPEPLTYKVRDGRLLSDETSREINNTDLMAYKNSNFVYVENHRRVPFENVHVSAYSARVEIVKSAWTGHWIILVILGHISARILRIKMIVRLMKVVLETTTFALLIAMVHSLSFCTTSGLIQKQEWPDGTSTEFHNEILYREESWFKWNPSRGVLASAILDDCKRMTLSLPITPRGTNICCIKRGSCPWVKTTKGSSTGATRTTSRISSRLHSSPALPSLKERIYPV